LADPKLANGMTETQRGDAGVVHAGMPMRACSTTVRSVFQ
jgi:hypothetical protein